jgi:flavodoxin
MGMNFESKWYGNGATQQVIYPIFADGDGTWAMKVYYEYRLHDVSLETVERLHSYLLKFFELAVSKDDITIAELLRIE